jgi:cell division protein FtsA
MMAKEGEIIVGLDVGTTRVTAVVGEVKAGGELDVIGVGVAPSNGISKGVVVDVDKTCEAIRKAIHEAELMAGCTVNAVYVGVSNGHIKSFNNRGVVAIGGGEVAESDVRRVIENARAVQIPSDRRIVATVPQEFLVDDNDGIKQPVGIAGGTLQVNVHIITARKANVQNVIQCCERANLHVMRVFSHVRASARAVLERDEKELGVVMVDIGGGTTDIAVFHNGSIVHSAVLPLGGDQVTNDIAIGLRTGCAQAEAIKLRYGCAMASMVDENEEIEVPSIGDRPPVERKRTLLCDIIEPRMEEIYRLIEREVQASNFADVLGAGVVVTGGTGLMPGVAELAEDVLSMPVRIGKPKKVGGLYEVVKASMFATAVGLVMQAVSEHDAGSPILTCAPIGGASGNGGASGSGGASGNGGWFDKFTEWLRQSF